MTFLFFATTILFYISINHFDGFEQDCILYTLQAINHFAPERFLCDPAFMFGNQDSFSIFSPLYSFLIRHLPIDTAALSLGLFTHIVIAIASVLMMWRWFRKFHQKKLALPAILLFFALFSYGEARIDLWNSIKTVEAFPVARSLSVAFGILGLAYFFDKKKLSLGFFVIGSLIHPLTVGWCLPLWFLYYFPKFKLPIIIASILFPLTIFIDRSPWMAYPPAWITVDFSHAGVPRIIQNFAGYFLIFVLLATKSALPKRLKKNASSFCIILGIAFYWFVISIATKHIFLFQVQTFRIQWLCHILGVIYTILLCANLYRTKIRKSIKLSFWNKITLVTIAIFWIDSPFVDCLCIFGLLAYFCRTRSFYFVVKTVLILLWIAVTIYAMHWPYFLHNHPLPDVYNSSQYFIQSVYQISAALSLVLFYALPRLRKAVIAVSFITFAVALWGTEIFPRSNYGIPFTLGVFIWGVSTELQNLSCRIRAFGYGTLAILLLACSFYSYDHRSIAQKKREHAMNQFVKAPPFPYIEQRGHILYAVQNYGELLPRIAFLSGAYYDEQYLVGSIFIEKHKYEALTRQGMLYNGENSSNSDHSNASWLHVRNRIKRVLFNKDSLINRTDFLCKKNEISHLISDMADLPYNKADSLTLEYDNTQIYLYPCNGADYTTQP